MKILLDAMGGDYAPEQMVKGALLAAESEQAELILVGREAEIREALRACGREELPENISVVNADDVVDMHADPAHVVQQHRESSMVVGLKMLAQGEGDAFISAGNTGALLTAATLIVKRIRGIRRAAFAPVMPLGSGSILVDAGANAECTPEFLLQFGCMGSIYAKKVLKKPEPTVALLNNGAEESKGDALHKQAHALLRRASDKGLIYFVGNIEARDVPESAADVIVADGFSGNVLLKSIEGTALYMGHRMKKIFKKNPLTMLGALLCKSGINDLQRSMDYREVGGSLLLGISRPVIKAHGSSDAVAVRSAVRQAIGAVSSGFCDEIRANIGAMRMEDDDAD